MDNEHIATVSAITRRVYEYAYGIDTRDWDLYRSIFTREIRTNFTSYNGSPPTSMRADDWVSNVRVVFTGLDATQHSMSNPLVDVLGDRGRCRMYMQAEHFLDTGEGSSDYTIGGYYDNQLRRVNDEWRISSVTLNVLWHRGNRDIMDLASDIGRERLNP